MLTSASQLHAEFEPIRYIMQSSVVHWALYPLTLHQLALKERLLKSESLSTEGAVRRPMTYDNHPIRHIALNKLKRPKIDLSRPSMN